MISVKSVKPLEGFNVLITFSSGDQKVVNLEPLLRSPIFEPRRNDPEFFRSVRVDEELGTILWRNGADIDPDVLYGPHVPAWMEEDKALAS